MDDYGPTELGAVLVLSAVAGVGLAVGVLSLSALLVRGAQALLRWVP